MSLEDVRRISVCELKAHEARAQALQEAKKLAASSEREGRELAESLKASAEKQAKGFLEDAEKTAAVTEGEIKARTAKECDALRVKAETNLEKAADFILERIVNA